MRSKLQCAVTLGWMLSVAISMSACSRDTNSNVPVSDAGTSAPADTAAPSAATDQGGSTTPNTDLTSAFPIDRPKKEGAAAPTSSVPIQIVDEAEYKAVLEKHRGKVVLVDCWATWCGPCTEQFPHTVDLGRKHADKGLAVVSMSFNDPDQQPEVAAFLEKQNAGFDHLISKFGASVESFVKFEIEGGALPYYKLYDRAGKLRYQFTGNIDNLQNILSIEELEKRLDELLAERA
jgi:thiol-disulfide isomerase/thioredoxin